MYYATANGIFEQECEEIDSIIWMFIVLYNKFLIVL